MAFNVVLGIKNSGLKKGLEESRKDVSQFKRDTESAFSGVGSKLAGAFAIGVAGGKAIMNMAGDLQDTADSLNLTTDSLQELQYAFGQSGTDSEKFNKGMLQLKQSIEEAKNGNEGALASFEKLGVTFADLKTMSPDEILMKMAQGFSEANGDGAALAAVMDLLGKSGAKMAAGMSAGAEGLQELREEAQKLSKEDIAKLDAAGDAMGRLWNRVKVFSAEKMTPLLEVLGQLATGKFGEAAGTATTPGERAARKEAAEEAAKKAAELAEKQKNIGRATGEVFGPTRATMEAAQPVEDNTLGPHRRDFENEKEVQRQRLEQERKQMEGEAQAARLTRARGLRDVRISQQEAELGEMQDTQNMTPVERANARRAALRKGIRDRQAERKFIRKHGAEALQEVKDARDPAKQIEAAFEKAMSPTESRLDEIKTTLEENLKFPAPG